MLAPQIFPAQNSMHTLNVAVLSLVMAVDKKRDQSLLTSGRRSASKALGTASAGDTCLAVSVNPGSFFGHAWLKNPLFGVYSRASPTPTTMNPQSQSVKHPYCQSLGEDTNSRTVPA